MHEDIKEVLYSEEAIAARVAELGAQITAKYAECAQRGEKIILISVLRGAATFMADLARRIELPITMDYMAVSSYGNAAKSSGTVRIVKDLSEDIAGAHVIIAEDIIDSGLTLTYLLELLGERGPASIEIVAFMRKQVEGQADVPCELVGFECPNEFIVGYGLDFAERYRNLPYVGILKPEVYS